MKTDKAINSCKKWRTQKTYLYGCNRRDEEKGGNLLVCCGIWLLEGGYGYGYDFVSFFLYSIIIIKNIIFYFHNFSSINTKI
jgi:hypothetical protein